MQSLWKKAVFCALILTSCLPVSAMNTTGKQPQEDPQNPVSFAAAVKKDGKWGVINDRAEVVIPMQYDKAAITLAPDNLQTKELSTASPSRWNLIEVQQGEKTRVLFPGRSGHRPGVLYFALSLDGRYCGRSDSQQPKCPV